MAFGINKARRNSKSAIIYIPFAIILIALLTAAGTSVFLRINVIEIIGSSVYSNESIAAAAGISAGDNRLFLNAENISRKILSEMPYIREATVEFKLPDTVRINISATSAIAMLPHAEGALIIDSYGKILEQTDDASPQLLEIRGIIPVNTAAGEALKTQVSDESKLRHLIAVLRAMEDYETFKDVTYIDISNISRISFDYEGWVTVIIGSSEDAQYVMENLAQTIENTRGSANYDAGVRYRIDITDRNRGWQVSPDYS